MFRYLPEFIQFLTLRGLCPSTIAEVKSDLTLISKYLPSPVQSISQALLEKALLSLKTYRSLKEVSFNRKLSSLKTFFAFLQRRGIIQENPLESLPFAVRIKGLPVHLAREEVQGLLSASSVNFLHHCIIHTFYELGLRLSELINLKISDVDSSSMQIRVFGKRRKVRYVPFSQELLNKLRQLVRTEHGYRTKGPLFLSPDYSSLTPSFLQRLINFYARKAGIKKRVSPKTLRHSFATHSLEAGVTPFALKKTLGHSELSSTMRYTHISNESLQDSHRKFLAYAFSA